MSLPFGTMKRDGCSSTNVGALRNNNLRGFRETGPDTGYDSIGDFSQAQALSRFLNKLDTTNQLTKTIIYNLNPADNELMATNGR